MISQEINYYPKEVKGRCFSQFEIIITQKRRADNSLSRLVVEWCLRL